LRRNEGRDVARASSFFHFSIAICGSFSFQVSSIWRSETFPRLLLCNSDCSLAVSRASTNCARAPAKECGLDPGENIQDWRRTASALPNGLFSTCSITRVQSPVVRQSPFNSGCGAVSGLAAVGSALITSVVGTPRLIQFSLKYSF
jgi:hypothetical protein